MSEKTITANIDSATNCIDNISFLLSLSKRRYDCILRTCEVLKKKLGA
jgi:hypothetical protein